MLIDSTRPVRRRAACVVATLLGVLRPASLSTAALLLLLPITTTSAQTPPPRAPLTERERAIHLLSRATYGVRERDVEELLRMGRSAWLEKQLTPQYPPVQPGGVELNLRFSLGGSFGTLARSDRALFMTIFGAYLPVANLIRFKIDRAARSERQLEELMSDFWLNHFSVSHQKAGYAFIADYEDMIWRHVFGRFEDLLVATAGHSAMVSYLDNFASRYPDGINENYARELLELHTLGVDGGYTQKDIVEVARAFTGWTRTDTRPFAFEYRAEFHDRNVKLVLGQALPAGRGREDGLDVLHLLARHPSTARHIATKLVQHFVSDDPPPELVSELTDVFLRTDGDLREVTRALFESEDFYDPAHYRAKVKRPFEFIAGALRASGLENAADLARNTSDEVGLAFPLYAMGHLPYTAPAPTGYPTTAPEWVNTGAMVARMNFAVELTAGRVAWFVLDPSGALDFIAKTAGAAPADPAVDPRVVAPSVDAITTAVLQQVLYGTRSERLHAAIVSDLEWQGTNDPRQLVARALALAIGSPEFQRY